MSVLGIYNNEIAPLSSIYTSAKTRLATRDENGGTGSGDTLSFSKTALDALRVQNDNFRSSSVSTTLGSTAVTFSNSTGAITMGGTKLNLSGFANTLKDDVVIKDNAGTLEVYNITSGKKATLDSAGKVDVDSITDYTGDAASLSTALFINNKGFAATGSSADDVMINRQALASVNGDAGNDKIFNFAAKATVLNGGGGNDSIYSVGLTSEAEINVSSGNGYVKLIGGMSAGGKVLLGTGVNMLDASGQTLSGVKISDTGSSASAIMAGTLGKGSVVALSAGQAALDIKALSSSTVVLDNAAGANSIVVDKVTGNSSAGRSLINANGTNTYKLGAITGGDVISNESKSDAMNITGNVNDSTIAMGKGNNYLGAAGRKFTDATILAGGDGTATTTIVGGSFAGYKKGGIIELSGSNGNTVDFSGGVTNSVLKLGDGSNTFKAGSIGGTGGVTLDQSGSKEAQNVTVKGAASKFTYVGSSGADTLNMSGAVSNSTIDLGDGDNVFNAVNQTTNRNQGVSNTTLTASGTGSNTLTMGAFSFGTGGAVIGLGSGSNSITMDSVYGKGAAQLIIDASSSTAEQSLLIKGAVSNLTYTGSSGSDTVNIYGSVKNSLIDLGQGNNTFSAVSAAGKAQSVSSTDILASGTGSNTYTMGAFTVGSTGTTMSLSSGANTINMGSIVSRGSYGMTIVAGSSTETQTLNISGSASRLTYQGGSGADNITVSGATSNSNIDLGQGLNSFTAQNLASNKLQNVSNTQITASGTDGNTLTMGTYTFNAVDGNEINLGSGANTVNMGSVTGKGTLGLTLIAGVDGTEAQNVNIAGSATRLTYQGGSGVDNLNVSGGMSHSNIDLGQGANVFSAYNSARTAAQSVTNTQITASGTEGNTLTMGKYTFNTTTGNEINLGSGANTVNMGSVAGKGPLGLTLIAGVGGTEAQNVNIAGSATRLTYQGGSGVDNLNVSGGMSHSNIDLGQGANVFSAYNSARTAAQSVTNTQITASGTEGNTLTMGKYTFNTATGNEINLGSGANTVNMGSVTGKGSLGLTLIAGVDGTEAQNVNIAGSATRLTYQGGSGADNIAVNGKLGYSNFNLGDGDNSFTATAAKSASVNTNITATGSGANTVNMYGLSTSRGSSSLTLGSGNDNVNFTGSLSGLTTVDMGGGTNNTFAVNALSSTGTSTGTTIKSSGGGTFSVNGAAKAVFDFAGGTDSVSLSSAKDLTGALVNLGGGSTTISAGTNASANIVSTTINGESGALTINAANLKSSKVDMTINDSTAAGLNLNLTGALDNSKLILGSGGSTLNMDTAKNGSRITLGGGTVSLTANSLGASTGSRVTIDSNTAAASSTQANTFTVSNGLTNVDFTGNDNGNNLLIGGNIVGSKLNLGGGTNSLTGLGGTNAESTGVLKTSTLSGSGANTINLGSIDGYGVKGPVVNLSGSVTNMSVGGTIKNASMVMGAAENNFTAAGVIGTGTANNVNITFGAADVTGKSNITLNGLNGGNLSSLGAAGSTHTLTLGGIMSGQNTINMGEGSSSIAASGATFGATTKDKLSLNLLGGGSIDFGANKVNNASINLGAGETSFAATAGMTNTSIKRTAAGTLTLDSGSIDKGTIALTDGADNLNVNGNLSANINLAGTGADTINVTGALSGLVDAADNFTLNASEMNKATVNLSGASNLLNVNTAFSNSQINLGAGTATVGAAGADYSNTAINGGDGNATINGKSYSSGTITLGNGNNNINVSGALSARINLGAGTNTVGASTTDLTGINFSGLGSNTILGAKMLGGIISMGADGKTNQLLVSGSVINGSITLNGGNNTIGNTSTALTNTTINSGAATGSNLITAKSLLGGSISMGDSNDTVTVSGTITGTTINLGGGTNLLNGVSV